MPNFTEISSGFANLSLSLAEDARQAGKDAEACMFIDLARAIFDLNEHMVARSKPVPKLKPGRRRALAVVAA